ncbi:hypothetical protein J4734_08315 [Klebsiella pneumoniae]|uniref:Uncharacterized protein n=1 Tax=Klebsiella pneumoniae TaxID=573 RepID=A0A939NRU4_KLEPN|nr:hypothetical protein [Klebsiella pneumoniae]
MHIAKMGYIMSSLQISQGTFRLSDTKTLKIDHLSVAAGESWAFVGSNGSGKSALARAPPATCPCSAASAKATSPA